MLKGREGGKTWNKEKMGAEVEISQGISVESERWGVVKPEAQVKHF